MRRLQMKIPMKRFISKFLCAALICATGVLPFNVQIHAGDTATWVLLLAPILRIDGDPPKEWNLYKGRWDRDDKIVLLQWGSRYLRVDTHAQEVRELDPHSVTKQKEKLQTPSDVKSAKVLPANDWIVRDVGAAWRIHFVLSDEKHDVDINIPTSTR